MSSNSGCTMTQQKRKLGRRGGKKLTDAKRAHSSTNGLHPSVCAGEASDTPLNADNTSDSVELELLLRERSWF